MTDLDLAERLHTSVEHEPRNAVDVDAFTKTARRRRRRRSLALSSFVALGVVAIVAGGVIAAGWVVDNPGGKPRGVRTATSATSVADRTTPMSVTSREPRPPGVLGEMVAVIEASSPPRYTFELVTDRLDGDWIIDGTADDGDGRGRLLVSVTRRPGMLSSHPCADVEFAPAGVACNEEVLDDGSLLVTRGALPYRDQRTTAAVLRHPDGSGVGVEAGNYEITPGSPAVAVTRDEPLYTGADLARLVEAIDARARAAE